MVGSTVIEKVFTISQTKEILILLEKGLFIWLYNIFERNPYEKQKN